MTKTETNQIKELFDNAVAVALKNTDIQRTIYDTIQKTITTAVANAVDCYEIRRTVEQKIKDAVNIQNLDFGNYGKFVENVFKKAVKDFELEQLDQRLTKIAREILGAPDKKEYNLWEDILRLMIAEAADEEEDDIEEYGYSAYAFYRRSYTDFGGEWIDIIIKENKYSSYEKDKITIYHDQEKDKWELISCTCPCGFEISDTYDTLTFKKSFNEAQKRIIDLVMKGCTLTGVDTALSYLSEE